MTTYNSLSFIDETIRSILNQEYKNWELIITDDCSSDSTLEHIRNNYKSEKRIQINKLERNSGAGIARNFSIKKANGEYIAFCDSDDIWAPEKLKVQLQFMKKNNCSFSYTNYSICDENGRILLAKQNYFRTEVTYKTQLTINLIGTSTVLINQSKVGKVYMSSIRNRQDWVLWLNILKRTPTAYGIPKVLTRNTKRSNSISNHNKTNLIKYHWKVYRDELGYNYFQSIILLFNNIIHHAIKKSTKDS